MKYTGVFLLLGFMVCPWIWLLTRTSPKPTKVLWSDEMLKELPKNMDTNIVVEDQSGTALRFRQYIKPLFNQEAMLYQDKGQWKLQRLNRAAIDSLEKDDHAIARSARWDAYRNRHVPIEQQQKLEEIAHTLAMGDHVLVLKGERKLFVTKKGVRLLELPINLGFSPVGNKVSDGDGKTPEGIYHLDLKQEREDGLYKSFWISYPNAEDKLLAKKRGVKPGVGIMIHGTTSAKKNAKDWTAGCIALANKDIDSLFEHLTAGAVIEIRK